MILVFEAVNRRWELSAYPINSREALELLIARMALSLGLFRDLVSELEEVLGWETIRSQSRKEGIAPDVWLEMRLRNELGLPVRAWASRDEFLGDLVPIFPYWEADLEILAEVLPEEEPDWVRTIRDCYAAVMVLAV